MKSYTHIEFIQAVLYVLSILLIAAGVVIGIAGAMDEIQLSGFQLVVPILGLVISGFLFAAFASVIELLTEIAKS